MLRRNKGASKTAPAGGPRSLQDRLRSSLGELDAARLQTRFDGVAITPIGDAETRVPVRIGGEVRSHRVSSSVDAPVIHVTISDGTGTAMAEFSGRRHIGGLHAGRAVVLEGVARRERGKLILRDPAYTLLP